MQQCSNAAKLTLILLFSCFSSFLMAQQEFIIPPDFYPDETPSKQMRFYPNLGQVIDTDGDLRPEIAYYTLGGVPRIYASDDKISMTMLEPSDVKGQPDDLYRLDILPYKSETETPITPHFISSDHVNFYYPHCSQGITNVHGYDRIVYENYFPDIDMHLTSNANGLKTFFVVKPGANPNDIQLELQGQDVLGIIANGNLRAYMDQDYIEIPQAIAYEVDGGGNVTGTTWTPSFYTISSDVIGFNIGTYNTSEYLVLEIVNPTFPNGPTGPTGGNSSTEWASFYGGNENDVSEDITIDANRNVYLSGRTESDDFPRTFGQQSVVQGSYDAFVVSFDGFSKRLWSTYYGGDDSELRNRVALTTNNLIIAGLTQSSNFPLLNNSGVGYYDNTFDIGSGKSDIYLAKVNTSNGTFNHVTLFGEDGSNEFGDLVVDENNQYVYVSGTGDIPTNTITPISNTGYSFISRFDFNLDFIWSTRFGTNNTDLVVINALDIDDVGSLFLGGKANSNSITLTNTPNTMDYSSNGDTDPFMAKLDINGNLQWSTYYGGNSYDEIYDIKVDKKNNYIYASGFTLSNAMPVHGTSLVNQVNISSSGHGFVLRLKSDLTLDWASFTGTEAVQEIEIDDNGNSYFVGNSTNSNMISTKKWIGTNYYTSNNNGNGGAFILGCDVNTNLQWFTYFGSDGATSGITIAFTPSKLDLYIAGHSNSAANFPFKDANNWFQNTNTGNFDCFIAKFDMDYFLVNTENIINHSFKTTLFPSITNSLFTLKIEAEYPTDYNIEIHNILGQRLISKKLPKQIEHQINFDMSLFGSGSYFVTIRKDKELITKKVIVVR